MAAILPSFKLDSDRKVSKSFLPHQVCWIQDESPMRLAEKSVRIGWTYADAFKAVRSRIQYKNRDYLFATKDQASATEYAQNLPQARRGVQHDALHHFQGRQHRQSHRQKLTKGESFTEEIKFNYIKFENGSRILAFSSNPYAMAVFGGDVGLDEFAKHQNAEKLWETAQGRSHLGLRPQRLVRPRRHRHPLLPIRPGSPHTAKGGWSYYRVTMEDAVELGLVEKINSIQKTNFTREGFIQDCKNRARLPEIYEQAYNCNPSGSTSAIVPWTQIENCRRDYQIVRLHMEAREIAEMFGSFNPSSQAEREIRIRQFIKGYFAKLFKTPALYRLGFDVAASGQGDLAAIYIDAKEAPRLKLSGLFTCRTDDWNVLKTVLWTFHENLSALQSAGDETGLGRQICWETARNSRASSPRSTSPAKSTTWALA